MTKTEFVNVLAEHHDFSRQEAERVLAAFLDAMEDGLCRDGKIALKNLGTFTVGERKERVGRHPRTGKSIKIEASKTIIFRAARSLKEDTDK